MVYDVAIIGAGVTGAMTARELSRYELSVCVIEKESDVAMGASKANSGIVHAGFDAKSGTLKARFNVEGSLMMEKITKELGVKYKRNGSMVLAFREEERDVLLELYERGIRNGVGGLEIINGERIRELEENVSDKALYALHAKTGAIVCPYELTIAAMGHAMDNGVELFLESRVLDISCDNGAFEVETTKGTIKARYIINAAGLYADKISRMVGDDSFEITPRKGEYLLLDKELCGLVGHTIFKVPTKMGKGVLVSPTVDGNILLGPTSEDIYDKEDTQTTRVGIEKIINSAAECVKNIPFVSVITSFTGLRATTKNGDFLITAPKPNFLNLAGIDSPGLTAAPAIAVHVSNMLKDMGLELVEKKDYTSTRKIYQVEKSRYNKMVCRCEKVSEGKIIEAIHTNPKAITVDAIKRRTRSGMGRCQGGFCMPSVVSILARELGIDVCEVRKSGGDSRIVVGKKE